MLKKSILTFLVVVPLFAKVPYDKHSIEYSAYKIGYDNYKQDEYWDSRLSGACKGVARSFYSPVVKDMSRRAYNACIEGGLAHKDNYKK